MADNIPMGMEFARFSSLPSLTGDGLGKVLAATLVDKSGLGKFINDMGKSLPGREGIPGAAVPDSNLDMRMPNNAPPGAVPPLSGANFGLGLNPNASGMGMNPNLGGGLSVYGQQNIQPVPSAGLPAPTQLPPLGMSQPALGGTPSFLNLQDAKKILGFNL